MQRNAFWATWPRDYFLNPKGTRGNPTTIWGFPAGPFKKRVLPTRKRVFFVECLLVLGIYRICNIFPTIYGVATPRYIHISLVRLCRAAGAGETNLANLLGCAGMSADSSGHPHIAGETQMLWQADCASNRVSSFQSSCTYLFVWLSRAPPGCVARLPHLPTHLNRFRIYVFSCK